MTKVQTDGLLLHPDEALELCIHHLRLAHLFYQSIPTGTASDEISLLMTELRRQLTDNSGKVIHALDYPAYQAFIETVVKTYAKDKELYND